MGSVDTMAGWPLLLTKTERSPESWVDDALTGLNYRHLVFFPSQQFSLFKRRSVIMALTDGGFLYADKTRRMVIPFGDIIACRHLNVLLLGKFMLMTADRNYRVEYNLTRDSYLLPFVKAYREYIRDHSPEFTIDDGLTKTLLEGEGSIREMLFHKNLKMYNYLSAILPDGHGKELIYYQKSSEQTGIRSHFQSRHYYTPYLIVKTEHEIILLNEEAHISKNPDDYGLQMNYIEGDETLRFACEDRGTTGDLRILRGKRTLFKLHVPNESLKLASQFAFIMNRN